MRIIHNSGTKISPDYVESLSGHVKNLKIKGGDIVKRGEKIRTIGNLNGYYFAHLHIEMRTKIGMPIGWGYSEKREGFAPLTRFIRENRPGGGILTALPLTNTRTDGATI